jgi:hypothetical protein
VLKIATITAASAVCIAIRLGCSLQLGESDRRLSAADVLTDTSRDRDMCRGFVERRRT